MSRGDVPTHRGVVRRTEPGRAEAPAGCVVVPTTDTLEGRLYREMADAGFAAEAAAELAGLTAAAVRVRATHPGEFVAAVQRLRAAGARLGVNVSDLEMVAFRSKNR